MREIKFRGKLKSDGSWVIGDLVQRGGATYIFPPDGLDSCDLYEAYPETVGQYTGLKDKNGKEIYEGDIVKGIVEIYRAIVSKVSGVVEFNNGCFNIDGTTPLYELESPEYSDYAEYDLTEVIGNIYENPELLEVT